jgi:hypothetical protein
MYVKTFVEECDNESLLQLDHRTFLGMTVVCPVYAEDNGEPKILSIDTNYPIEDDAVHLPNDFTEFDVHVDMQNSKAVRFYYETQELDSRHLIKEELNPSVEAEYEMNFNPTDGFARKIIIEAISEDGTATSKEFNVYKTIDEKSNDHAL